MSIDVDLFSQTATSQLSIYPVSFLARQMDSQLNSQCTSWADCQSTLRLAVPSLGVWDLARFGFTIFDLGPEVWLTV